MLRPTHKPVRKCHACLLNQGDRCWGFANPRAQWRRKRGCPGFGNARVASLYQLWKKQASIKTPRDIRRECIHHRPPEPVYYLEPEYASHLQGLRHTFGV